MRISLLMKREPFGRILAETLEHFWETKYEREFSVRWRPFPHLGGHTGVAAGQVWHVNPWVNAIYTSQFRGDGFGPIRREYSHSLVAWRRPLQSAYVSMATSKPFRGWLSTAFLDVRSPVQGAETKLIVPGNHKIRMLDHSAKETIAILKRGFDSELLGREVSARALAGEHGVPVATLYEYDERSGWLREEYVVGTPLNRLPSPERRRRALKKVLPGLKEMLRATAGERSALEYSRSLAAKIRTQVGRVPALTDSERRGIVDAADGLADLCGSCISRDGKVEARAGVRLSQTHGDFQPGNILVEGGRAWLIDWEYADRRQADYDLLTFGLAARAPKELSARVVRFVESGGFETELDWGDWRMAGWGDRQRRLIDGCIFLLEEILLHLREDSNPNFKAVGEGLRRLPEEAQRALRYLRPDP